MAETNQIRSEPEAMDHDQDQFQWIDLNPDEMGIASRRASERLTRAAGARASAPQVFGVYCGLGLIASLLYQAAQSNPDWWRYGPPLLLLLAFGASAWLALRKRRRLLARLDSCQTQRFGIAFDAGGVAVRSDRGDFRYRWQSLETLESDTDGVTLHFKGFQALWIPGRLFADSEARRALTATIESASGLQAIPGKIRLSPPMVGEPGRQPLADFFSNLRAGLLLVLCRSGAIAHLKVSVGQFLALVAASIALSLAIDLLSVGSRGMVNWYAIPFILYGVPWLLLAPWAAGRGAPRSSPLAGAVALAALWLPIDVFWEASQMLAKSSLAPAWLGPQGTYLTGAAAVAYGLVASMVALVRTLDLPQDERMAAVLAVIGLLFLPSMLPREEARLWVATHTGDPDRQRAERERRLAPAREEALYAQSRLLDEAVARIQPGRPGKPELFLLAVGGHGGQDVFKREVESVQQLFDQRFGTRGHSLVLVNNPETVLHRPMASLTALRRGLQAMGKRMNRDEDVLLLFMTSHGSAEHGFDLSLWPYRFDELTPKKLKELLDEAGIRYRVVVVSACYSGGFVPPLAGDDTLVISASRADRNSHGCSHEADWTFFGKAFFDEALRQTVSLEGAFSTTTQTVAAREKAEGLTPSEPQIATGKGIRRALSRLEKGWPSQAKP